MKAMRAEILSTSELNDLIIIRLFKEDASIKNGGEDYRYS